MNRTNRSGPQLGVLLSVAGLCRSKRTTFLLAAIVAALVLAAPANANYRVGISEQDARVFSQPAWQALKLKRVRYVVAWDYYKDPGQVAETTTFMNTAQQFNQDVLVMFTAHRGCWNGALLEAQRVPRAFDERLQDRGPDVPARLPS